MPMIKRQTVGAMLVGTLLLLAGTSGVEATPNPNQKKKLVRRAPPGHPKPYQVGRASWYAGKFQGRKTASGEQFDTHQLTAAHLTLPLGTWVRVTNLRTHRSVVVRINDRGPQGTGSIIDLSLAAARQLGGVRAGVFPVRLELVKQPAFAG